MDDCVETEIAGPRPDALMEAQDGVVSLGLIKLEPRLRVWAVLGVVLHRSTPPLSTEHRA
jgi:hypothetical protein